MKAGVGAVSFCGVCSVVGSVVGWTGSVVLIAVDTPLPDERQLMLTMLLLALGAFSSAVILNRRRSEPLGFAFELGYNAGRRDAIREATARTSVSPIRRVPNGLSSFGRERIGS
jgi:hypothetical protein